MVKSAVGKAGDEHWATTKLGRMERRGRSIAGTETSLGRGEIGQRGDVGGGLESGGRGGTDFVLDRR